MRRKPREKPCECPCHRSGIGEGHTNPYCCEPCPVCGKLVARGQAFRHSQEQHVTTCIIRDGYE